MALETHFKPRTEPAIEARRPSTLVNRNVTVAGHRTSVRLEPATWEALRQVCQREQRSLNGLVTEISRRQVESSLTAAIRVFLMSYFRAAANGGNILGSPAPRQAGLPPR